MPQWSHGLGIPRVVLTFALNSVDTALYHTASRNSYYEMPVFRFSVLGKISLSKIICHGVGKGRTWGFSIQITPSRSHSSNPSTLAPPLYPGFHKGHGTSTWHKKIQVLTFTLPIQDFKLLPLNSSSDLTAIKSSANFSDHTRARTDFGLS